MTIPSMDGGTSSMDESVIGGCHPGMEKPHPLMISTNGTSSMDEVSPSMDGEMSSMDESVIGGCHP